MAFRLADSSNDGQLSDDEAAVALGQLTTRLGIQSPARSERRRGERILRARAAPRLFAHLADIRDPDPQGTPVEAGATASTRAFIHR
ncbi:hypothetical protein [Sorangium sp. So ce233]|uniref:hypothetical protein n=1 Tax=Sorangium sp. So ce233 TaxID=3133290 RepID=UPI003F5E944C